MAFMIKPVTDIVLQISFPENDWGEVAEIDIVFGKEIIIIYNSSYREGFGKRSEETTVCTVNKHPDVNPCVMCEDIAKLLAKEEWEDDEEPEKVIDRIKEVIGLYNLSF